MSISPSPVITSSATWMWTTRPMTIAARLPSFGAGRSMVCMYLHSTAIGESFRRGGLTFSHATPSSPASFISSKFRGECLDVTTIWSRRSAVHML